MAGKIKKAVFPVGGLGTRFLPATKAMPKEMLPVVDKPLIQYAFEEAREAGIEQFIFITGRNKSTISDHFDHAFELQQVLGSKAQSELLSKARDWIPKAGQTAFVRQQDALGLGHAVLCARNFVGDEPFAVLLADELFMSKTPMLKEMVRAYEKTGGNIIAVDEIEPNRTKQYGIVDLKDNKSLKIKGMVEKPAPKDAPSNLAIIGRYILQPQIFEYLEKTKKGSGGEYQLTDAMSAMLDDSDFYALKLNGKRFDCGSKIGFFEANVAFALERDDLGEDAKKIIKKYSDKI